MIIKKVSIVRKEDAVISPCIRKHILVRVAHKPHLIDGHSIPSLISNYACYFKTKAFIDDESRLLLVFMRPFFGVVLVNM